MTGISSFLTELLNMTAWEMEQPAVGGMFHIAALLIVTVSSCTAAVFVARIGNGPSGDPVRIRILTILGWILLFTEIYKQLFYYFIINDQVYDWWYFPFQLCSVPMYLCILLPFLNKKLQTVVLTFMCGYTFVGAVAALIWPAGMLKPYVMLTMHGQIWHGILLFISVMIGLSGMADLTLKGFLRSSLLFLLLCGIATLINIIAEPISTAHPVYIGNGAVSYPSMFYLSPYHLSNQPVISQIDVQIGHTAAMIIYILLIMAAAGLVDFMFSIAVKHNRHRETNAKGV